MATFTVDTAFDVTDPTDGSTSLREALALANADPDPDTIGFAPSLAGTTLALVQGELVIETSLTIDGPATDRLVIDAQGQSRVMSIDDGDPGLEPRVVLRDLALRGGDDRKADYFEREGGAGIYVANAAVRLEHVAVTNNRGDGPGPGILNQDGNVVIEQSEIAGNQSYSGGGGIFNAGYINNCLSRTLR